MKSRAQTIRDLQSEIAAHYSRTNSGKARLFHVLSHLRQRVKDRHLIDKIMEARSIVRTL